MMLRSKFIAASAAAFWLFVSATGLFAAGVNISGQVTDGTTGKPVAGQHLQLLMPQGGMQQVATAVTDASGQFVVAAKDLATRSFFLLQTNYQGVDYNTPVKFDDRGEAKVDVTVYDATHTAPAVRIQSARIILHAEGDKVHVQEMFALRNNSSPPRSYVNSDGTFLFHLGKTLSDPSAAVAGLMNMPLPQPVNPGKGEGNYNIQYPLKPGLTVMMVAYDGDYGANKLDFTDSVTYPIDSVELQVIPPGLMVASQLFKPSGVDADSGGQKYVADNVPPNAQLAASLSGEAGAAEATGGEPQQGSAPPAESDGEVKNLPNSMTRMGGLMLACFLLVLLWGLGVRVTKEWPKWKVQRSASQLQKVLEVEVENLFNSIADLDELFAAGKITEKPYWKERLELKARLVAKLKKAPPALLESYAIRHTPR
jgi:hypothetical protein